MVTRTVDNIDDAYRVYEELSAAAEAGQHLRLTPWQCAQIAGMVVRGRSKAAPYLEAAVRQVGGRLHLDSLNLVRSTGSKVKYAPDHDAGHGGILWIADE